ncbi:hypothetical protein BK809_0007880 [Diplodia seriata]|uniref:Kinetochore protein fta4 n=1 Tax=Diplodia seriata TaxID=420778 RepID=A0A1S8BJR7_9PEZI|nr:hypothetical protein BK809_0007880 [Diplodia seriata]
MIHTTHPDSINQPVNRLLRRHTKSAYPSLAIRHVAEQIDALYWTAGAPPLSIAHPDDPSFHPDDQQTLTSTPLDDPSADLTAPSTIAALPPTWAEAATDDADDDAAAAARYETLVARLQELDGRRRAARRRLESCRDVRERVGALAAPRENVQVNLVTRDGELGRGVAEAKTLGVRVGARVGAWAEGLEGGREGDGVVGGARSREMEREKLRGLLLEG